ncbi:HK97-gp10 family putative phage morphogenesis protein [Clostridium felsineum]|uniref:Uncharacterized protein n=1 Tax=Clostridium felsineum TaxID=36839 RepID=A0A1S8KZR6_9CLOT|nr:HK97-gp10 family putative phage morphogenesis protein [Clostridium felsineum]URZ06487.1 hypothetical protein CLROS_018200 [Clostridium felsineum]URZ11522.1 hypothetical protein CROST_022390 [Clostridium felsineum]
MGVEASATDIGALIDRAEQLGLKVSSLENASLRAGAEILLNEAKENLQKPTMHHLGAKEFEKNSVVTKKLLESIEIGNPKKDKFRGGKYIKVFTSYPTAHLVEFGHAGPAPAPPHPFMRTAYQNKKEEVKRTIIEVLRAGIKL